ncbi:hypothetical protein HDU86_004969 [Geranomyces michiganensis]|nr:hypothetical protein HDU86_004969 [Geranomyces michiganensis]
MSLPPDFSKALDSYENALKLLCESKGEEKGPKLAALDSWVFGKFAESAREIGQMSADNLAELMQWKLLRGKFRPTLLAQVKANSNQSVVSASKAAFTKLQENKPLEALAELSKLKGVGPATASAILSAHSPDVPFMSDESLATIYPPTKIPYTVAAYKKLLASLTEQADELNKEEPDGRWTPGMVQRAIWAYNIIKNLEVTRAKDTKRKGPLSSETSPKGKKAKTG